MAEILSHIGNIDLLKQKKIAFLCSSKTTSQDILRSFDWAMSVPKDSKFSIEIHDFLKF